MATNTRTGGSENAKYAARTGMNSRASVILAKATFAKPETIETVDGDVIRVWKSSESSSYSNRDIASVLRYRQAVTADDMLGSVPPSAIKYCVTKRWLAPNAGGTLFFITLKAAIELDLPMNFAKGSANNGRRIRFAG